MKANIIPRGIHSTVWSGSTCALLLSFVLVAPLSLPLSRLHAQESEYALSDREIEKGDLVYLDIEHVFSETGERRIISSTNREAIDVEVGYPVWVRNDGSIHLPYLDPMKVAGSKPSQLAPIILEAYRKKFGSTGADSVQDISIYGVRHSREFFTEDYVARPGDVLAVLIDTVLGRKEVPIPVNYSSAKGLCPAFGYPLQVSGDGTMSIPLAGGSISVDGLSVAQIEEEIRDALTEEKEMITPFCRVMVAPLFARRPEVKAESRILKPGDTIAIACSWSCVGRSIMRNPFPFDPWPIHDSLPFYLPNQGDVAPFMGSPITISMEGTFQIGGERFEAAGLTLDELTDAVASNWPISGTFLVNYPTIVITRVTDPVERKLLDASTRIQSRQFLCVAGIPASNGWPKPKFHFPEDPRFGPAYGVAIPVDLNGRIRLPGVGLIEANDKTCLELSNNIQLEYLRRREEDPNLATPVHEVFVQIIGGLSK